MKNETYILCLQHIKSTIHNPIILTKVDFKFIIEIFFSISVNIFIGRESGLL